MKRLLLFLTLLVAHTSYTQSLDHISVRRKNGRVVKNFYSGCIIAFQTNDGSYFQAPIQAVRNDSLFLVLYDVRRVPTIYGGYLLDTITTALLGLHYRDISRIHLKQRASFLRRTVAPLLMLGGAGYLTLNVLNGALFSLPITDEKNLQRLGISAGAFGVGFLIRKLFASEGFTGRKHRIVYIDL